MSSTQVERLIRRLSELPQLMGVSDTTVWRIRQQDPTFPPVIRLGAGSRGVFDDALRAWLSSRT